MSFWQCESLPYCQLMIDNMIFQALDCLVNLKFYFRHFFAGNLGDASKEQGKPLSGYKEGGETIPETVEYQHDVWILLATSQITTTCNISEKKLCTKLYRDKGKQTNF